MTRGFLMRVSQTSGPTCAQPWPHPNFPTSSLSGPVSSLPDSCTFIHVPHLWAFAHAVPL